MQDVDAKSVHLLRPIKVSRAKEADVDKDMDMIEEI